MASALQRGMQQERAQLTKGYLQKKKKGRLLTSWKRRWFVLSEGKLLYYVSDAESKLKGSVDVACLSLQRNEEEGEEDRRSCFSMVEWNLGWLDGVESTDVPNRSYLMSAENDEQVEMWFNAIARAKTQHRKAKRRALETQRVLSAHDLLGLQGVSRMAEDYQLQLQEALPELGKRFSHAPSHLSFVLMPSVGDPALRHRKDSLASSPPEADDTVGDSHHSLAEANAIDENGHFDGGSSKQAGLELGQSAELDAHSAEVLECSATHVSPRGDNDGQELCSPPASEDDAPGREARSEPAGPEAPSVIVDTILCPPPSEPAPSPPKRAAGGISIAGENDAAAVRSALAEETEADVAQGKGTQELEQLLSAPASPSSFRTGSVHKGKRRTALLGQRNSFTQQAACLTQEQETGLSSGVSSDAGGDDLTTLMQAATGALGGEELAVGEGVESFAEEAGPFEALAKDVSPPLDEDVSAQVQESMPEKMNMLRMVARELLSTEKAYLRDLSKLQWIYIKPLLAESFLTREQHAALFSNTEELMDVSARLLGALRVNVSLEGDTNDYRIGAAFVQEIPAMKAFVTFCSAQNASVSTLATLCRTSPQFVRWMDATDADQPGQLGLNSFLVKPLQRLCKYPLLLRELLTHMQDDHPDRPNVVKADHNIAQLLFHANESKRREDNCSAMQALDDELRWPPGLSRTLAAPGRLLLRRSITRASVGSQKPAKSVIILMSDLLIAAKEKDRSLAVKGAVELRDAIVWEIKNPKLRHSFSVVQQDWSGSPKIVITCKTEDEKEAWIAEIMDAQTRLGSA